MKYLPHSSMYMEWFLDEEQYKKERQVPCPLEGWAEEKCRKCKEKEKK